MKGFLEIRKICAKTNKIISSEIHENTITSALRTQLAHMLAGDVGSSGSMKYIDRMQFGSGSLAETAADQYLQFPITPIKDVTPSYSYTGGYYYVEFEAFLEADEANGFPIQEAGLLCEDDTLAARKTFNTVDKTNEYIFGFRWKIRG